MPQNNTNKTVCALICEYNPFHKGHKYQLDILKSKFDYVVCIMSGSTVQRGEFAIADKYLRASAAVMEGADIVLELPYPYSSLGARDFAAAGVHIAMSLGIPTLAFGAEDSIDKLLNLTKFLSDKSTREFIINKTKDEKNLSYPQARQAVVSEVLGYDYGELLTKPNNILAIEYIIAGKDKINYYPIKRNNELKSATFIRSLSDENLTSELPTIAAKLYSTINRRRTENLSAAFLSKLRIAELEELSDIYDITKGFASRLIKAAKKAKNYRELIELSAASTDTTSKIRRAVLHCLARGTKKDALTMPRYTNLLAAKRGSLSFLKNTRTDIITVLAKPAHYKKLDSIAKTQFLLSGKVDDLAALSADKIEVGGKYLTSSPVIID